MPFCLSCKLTFQITAADLEFYSQVGPTIEGVTYSVPPPTLCPDCRFRRRLSFRNERSLYRRQSSLSGKNLISIFAPDSPYQVYDRDEWWSDAWDPTSFGRPFDFNRNLATQIIDLALAVPHPNLYNTNAENSSFTNYALNIKNCYLVFGMSDSEDCLYGRFVRQSRDAVDCLSILRCELCYEAIGCESCYECRFIMNSRFCQGCNFVEDCESCTDCLVCYGLKQKQYYVGNEFVGKERYQQLLKELMPLSSENFAELAAQLSALKQKLHQLISHIYQSEDCTGDTIYNSHNCQSCFDINDCEESKFLCYTPKGIRSYDCTFNAPGGVRFCYEVCSSMGEDCLGTFLNWNGTNVYYSMECDSCRDIFGCVGLKKRQYCILNKQFDRQSYFTLLPQIIDHLRQTKEWGEFFDPSVSMFAYNETVAQENYPLSAAAASALGWRWRAEESITPAAVPNDSDVAICKSSHAPFKIIPQERTFYEKMGLPLPALSPNERHQSRLLRRGARRMIFPATH